MSADAEISSDVGLAGIQLSSVSKVFRNGVCAINAFDITIPEHSLTAVLGPSGCGKSTLLRLICGLENPSSGSILIGGAEPATVRKAGRIGMAFQEPALLPWRTIYENIKLSIELRPNAEPADIPELLRLFRLIDAEQLYPHQLSGGMAQRTAVARAIASSPDILLLDEPFGSLDWFLRRDVIEDFQTVWSASQPTTLLVTHDSREAVFMADTIIVMSRRPGRVIEIMNVSFAKPRSTELFSDPEFRNICDHVDSLCARSYE